MLAAESVRVQEPPTVNSRIDPAKLAWGISILLVLLWSFLIDWEWSFVDDAGQKTALRDSVRTSGLLGGVVDHVQAQAQADWNGWGLFRPTYYLYTGLFYLSSPAIAHGLRLAMLLAVVLIPALKFAKRNGSNYDVPLLVWALCLFLANTTLYQGTTFLSLQELSGLALVALGLSTSNRWARAGLWLAAAWMKTPFVWLFLAWGVFLMLRRRTWPTGLVVLATGVATVVAAAVSARAGTYSSAFVFTGDQLKMSVQSAIPLFYWPSLIGVLGLIALRPRLKTIAWRDPLALVLAIGGLLYLGNLLPWGRIGVYYGSPVIWMLSAAAVRYLATAELRRWNGRFHALGVAVLVLTICATGYLVTKIVKLQYNRNEAVANTRTFALRVADEKPVIGINGSEAAARLQQIIRLHQPDWPGTVVYIDPADATIHPNYYVKLSDELGINTRLTQNPIHVWNAATVYAP